jgi:hypothetical protein
MVFIGFLVSKVCPNRVLVLSHAKAKEQISYVHVSSSMKENVARYKASCFDSVLFKKIWQCLRANQNLLHSENDLGKTSLLCGCGEI